MKKRVFNYIINNPRSDLHQISNDLAEEETAVLKVIAELCSEGFLGLCPPQKLPLENANSCYYKVTRNDYEDK
ncbi:MAG: hypothetical protein IJS45_00020 [Clostridia bacterium]|nr:hypothetical protein [Clostridia bacterium]